MDGRRVRGEQRRQELMSAGLSLVAAEGTEAVTHRAVANACGVSVTSVAYHYPTVDELKSGIFACAGDLAIEAVKQEAVTRPDRRRSDAATVAGEFVHRFCTEQRDLTSTLLQLLTAAGRDDSLRTVADRLNHEAEDIIAPLVGASRAPAVVAAVQGILLRALSLGDSGPDWAHATVHGLFNSLTTDKDLHHD